MSTEPQIALYLFGTLIGYAALKMSAEGVDSGSPSFKDIMLAVFGLASLLGALFCFVSAIALIAK